MTLGKPHKALMVLERSIGSSQGRKYVFVVNDKNQAIERTVQVGLLQGHLREITAGLDPNERIVINGVQRSARPDGRRSQSGRNDGRRTAIHHAGSSTRRHAIEPRAEERKNADAKEKAAKDKPATPVAPDKTPPAATK